MKAFQRELGRERSARKFVVDALLGWGMTLTQRIAALKRQHSRLQRNQASSEDQARVSEEQAELEAMVTSAREGVVSPRL